jgi:hypothetical protein
VRRERLTAADPTRALDPQVIDALLRTWPLRDPRFAELLHRSIDEAAGEWSDLTRAAYDREIAAYERRIAQHEHELERRVIERRKLAAEAELAQFEAK